MGGCKRTSFGLATVAVNGRTTPSRRIAAGALCSGDAPIADTGPVSAHANAVTGNRECLRRSCLRIAATAIARAMAAPEFQ
jgi:hypothetical protein